MSFSVIRSVLLFSAVSEPCFQCDSCEKLAIMFSSWLNEILTDMPKIFTNTWADNFAKKVMIKDSIHLQMLHYPTLWNIKFLITDTGTSQGRVVNLLTCGILDDYSVISVQVQNCENRSLIIYKTCGLLFLEQLDERCYSISDTGRRSLSELYSMLGGITIVTMPIIINISIKNVLQLRSMNVHLVTLKGKR